MKHKKHIMVFQRTGFFQRRKEKSRRDDTLLTVGFNLRMTDTERSSRSPAWDDTFLSVAYKMQVSSLRDFGAHDASPFRRLKPTVIKVPSLRDSSPLIQYF